MSGNGHVDAVGYVRCSTDMQEDSPDQQKRAIFAFAEKKGYRVIDWYIDFGLSGTTFKERPAFQRLRKVVEQGAPFRAVICWDESRWGRNKKENSYWQTHFEMHDVDVVLVRTSVDPKSKFAQVFRALESFQASDFSLKLSELTIRGALSNGIYSNGGTAPYGYRRMARNLVTGVIRPLSPGEWCVKKQEKVFWGLGEECEVKTVKHVLEQRSKGVSYVLIAKALNDQFVPCAKRGKWRNLDRKWSTGTIKSIIENPVYCGSRVYNRMSSSRIISEDKNRPLKQGTKSPTWRNPESDWKISDNAHEPIVSKELWDRANAVGRRKPNSKPNGHCYHSRYLLTGLIRCSGCGFAFQGWSGKVRGKDYLRYIDGGWQSKRVCSFKSIPKDLMENFAVQIIKETLSDPTIVSSVETKVKELLKVHQGGSSADSMRIREALLDNKRRSENLLRLVEEGGTDVATVRNRLLELEQEKSRLEGFLGGNQETPTRIGAKEISQAVARFILDFEKRFEQAPIEERKVLVQKCISQIVIDREKNVAKFYVRKVPAAAPALDRLFEAEMKTSVMSNQSARNPQDGSLTNDVMSNRSARNPQNESLITGVMSDHSSRSPQHESLIADCRVFELAY